MNQWKPSLRFRLRQLLFLPLRPLCWFSRKGHTWHKWACTRCLTVDSLRLAWFHTERLLRTRRPPRSRS